MTELVLATGNPGKVAEMQRTLAEFGFKVRAQNEFSIGEAVEDGLSFVENAIIKARYACTHTGLPAVADDSGLEVDALNGQPGIYSARYAEGGDDANNAKLLDAMRGIDDRTAQFQCVIVYMRHASDPMPLICHGTWHGEIATVAKGENGFGYDPIFFLPELGLHSAELDAVEKKRLSHRGQALAQLKRTLQQNTG